jgi:hypothetical protein
MIASSYKLTAMLFGTSVTLHNLEEAMFLVDWSCRHWLKFAPPWSTRGYPVLGITFLTLVRDPPPGLRLLFGDMQYVAVRFSAPGHLGFRSQRSG